MDQMQSFLEQENQQHAINDQPLLEAGVIDSDQVTQTREYVESEHAWLNE